MGAEAKVQPAVEISAAVDRGPWTWRQKVMLLIVGTAILCDGFDNQSLGLAAPAILQDWSIPKAALAPALALGQIGMLLGTGLGGLLGDKIGRKGALIAAVVVFGLATMLMAAAPNVAVLGALRVVAGIGLGGALPNAAALISEFTPAAHRTLAVAASIVCVPLGGVVGGVIASGVLPAFGWRPLFAFSGALPFFSVLLLWAFVPESPRFLVAKGADPSKVTKALAMGGIAHERAVEFTDEYKDGARAKPSGSLLGREFRADTLVLWIAFAFCLFAIYAAFSWLPTMLVEQGFDLAGASAGLAAYNLGGVCAALGAAAIIAHLGSRGPMIFMAIAAAAAAAALWFLQLTAAQFVLTMAMLAVLGGFVNGVQTVLYALAAHVYPVAFRSSGIGAASSFGRLGAIASSFVGAALLAAYGASGFYASTIVVMCVVAAALLLVRRHIERVVG